MAATFEGRPCAAFGHTERYVSNHNCAECARAKQSVYSKENREKVREYQDAWRDANCEKVREYGRKWRLRHRYGMTVDERDALLAEQDNLCAICGTSTPGGNGWNVDHCHDTGNVRGILCHVCNIGLGHFKDDIDTLRAAIKYLRKYLT